MKHFPNQLLSYAEKAKNDFKWAKDVMDALLINEAPASPSIQYSTSEYNRKLSNYQLYNNQINQQEFEDECNPLGLDVGQFKDSIKPYNKTYNKIQVLLGEELRRPFRYRPVLINANGVKSKLLHRDEMLRNYIRSKIQETIQEASSMYDPQLIQQDMETILNPEEIDRYINTKYLEGREILASKILQYFTKYLHIPEKKNEAFKHNLLSGDEIVWVDEVNGMPVLENINSLGFFCHRSAEVKPIEESLYAGSRSYKTSGDIITTYGAYLSDEDLKKIDKRFNGTRMFGAYAPTSTMDYHLDDVDTALSSMHSGLTTEGSYSQDNSDDWLVQHIEWMSQKAVGFLTMIPFGSTEPHEDIVDENFEIPSHAHRATITRDYGRKATIYTWTDTEQNMYNLEWGWLPEVWTGTRIGYDIYCMIGPKKHQFRDLDNPFRVKLGYHGISMNTMNAAPTSLMDRMKPFQYLYFIVMHKLKKLIARDRGKVFSLDASMVDPNLGWEKTLYYLDELDLDIFNPLQNAEKPGAYQRGKVTGSTDRSNMQHIMNYINLLMSLDQQISDVAGVNRQREGQTLPGEAVTNAESNRTMSSVITEIYFNNHDKMWERVLTSLIEVAQSCWKNKSITKQYALDDLTLGTLELTPDSLSNASFAVFISDSMKEQEVFDNLKALSQALIQNDKATFSDIIKTFRGDSIEELESEIIATEKKAIENQRAEVQQAQQAQLQAQQEEQAFQLEFQKREHENKITLEAMKLSANGEESDEPSELEVEKFKADVALKSRKLDLEEDKIKQQAKQKASK